MIRKSFLILSPKTRYHKGNVSASAKVSIMAPGGAFRVIISRYCWVLVSRFGSTDDQFSGIRTKRAARIKTPALAPHGIEWNLFPQTQEMPIPIQAEKAIQEGIR